MTPPQAVAARGIGESNSLEIAVHGQYSHVEFRFVDCTTARAPEISVVRESRTVCLVTSADRSLPPIWAYGAAVGTQSESKCEALMPGLYGIKVYGGEKGQAQFEIAEDGTVSVRGLTCAFAATLIP